MGTEIDRLEIAIEVEAAKANQQLSKLKQSLKELSSILSGIDISDSLGLEPTKNNQFTKVLDNINKTFGNTKDSAEKLQKAFADVGKRLKFTGNTEQLQKEIEKTEKYLDRLWAKEDKFNAIGGSINTQGWKSLQYDIARTSNYLQDLREQYAKLSSENLKRFQSLPIDRGVSSDIGDNTRRNATVSPDSLKYDPDAMKAVFGESYGDIQNWQQAISKLGSQTSSVFNGASDAAEEFEATIKKSRLSSEEFEAALEDLEIPEIDETNLKKLQATLDRTEAKIKKLTAQQANDIRLGAHIDSDGIRRLSRQIVELSKYADALNDKISEIGEASPRQSKFDKLVSSSKSLSKSFSNIRKSAGTFGKQVEKVFGRFLSLIKKFGSGISNLIKKSSELARKITGIGTGNKAGKNFGIGKMLGTSLLFSGVFQAIGAINSAVTEGSDNLVQYSAQYNASISSMVSALYTLKNAFAVAFSPIINVVAPYITAFINMLNAALNKVGQFFAALTGKKFATQAVGVAKDYADSLTGVGKNAGGASDALKDLNKAVSVLGFDELNKLQDINDSGSGSAGNGLGELSPSDMFQDVRVDDAIKEFADKLKAAWKKADFDDIGKTLGDKINSALGNIPWNKIKNTVRKIGKSLATFLNGSIETINWNQFGNTISQGLNTAFEAANTFVQNFHFDSFGKAIGDGINGIVNGIDWPLINNSLKRYVKGIGDTINNAIWKINWKTLGNTVGNGLASIVKAIDAFISTIDWAESGKAFANGLYGVFEKLNFKDVSDILIHGVDGIFSALRNFVKTFKWDDLAINIYTGINHMIHGVNWTEASKTLNLAFENMLQVFQTVAKNVDWQGLGKAIGEFLSNINWGKHFSTVVKILGEILSGLLAGMAKTSAGKFAISLGSSIAAINIASSVIKLINTVGKVITGNESYGIVASAFSKLFKTSTKESVAGLNGLNTAIGNTSTWMLKLKKSAYDTSVVFGLVDGAINRTKIQANATNYSALMTALSRLSDNGSITSKEFNNLYGKLVNAQRATVPFSDSLAYVQDELKKSGVASEKFKDQMSKALDDLKVSSSNKAKIIGLCIGDGTTKGLAESRKKVEDANKSIIDKIKDAWTGAQGFDIHSPSRYMYNVATNIIAGLNNGVNSSKNNLLYNFAQIPNQMISKFANIGKNFMERGRDIISGLKSGYTGNSYSLYSYLGGQPQIIGSKFGNLGNIFSQKGMDAVLGLKNGWQQNSGSIYQMFSCIPQTLSKRLGSLYNIGRNAITGFKNGFQSVHIPTPSFSVSSSRYTWGSSSFSIPKFSLRWFANGGFPNAGELFMANENGPEMIGKMGNRNVVANNKQITDGIKDAVVEGMMEVAMATSSGQSDNKPYILHAVLKTEDNEVLARAVEKGNMSKDWRYNPCPAY